MRLASRFFYLYIARAPPSPLRKYAIIFLYGGFFFQKRQIITGLR